MKNFKSYLAGLAVFALLFTSCSKDESMQNPSSDEVASLTFSSILADFNRSTDKQSDELPDCSLDAPAYAEISLEYGSGNVPVNTTVAINMDSDGYFTEYSEDLEIPIPSGEDWVSVSLKSFEVYSATDDLIWKAPMEGSAYEGFVTDALPINFDLRAGSKNYQDVEVLCFDDRMVNLYGYQFFDIIPQELRELCFFANYCSDEGRHYTANYELDLWYFTGSNTDVPPTGADLEVFYTNRSPVVGMDAGAYYADPLCLAIPEPQMGEGPNDAYLYYEVTLTAWEGNYALPGGAVTQSGFLSWNDVKDLLDTDDNGDFEDNDDVDYWHVFLNCEDDDGGNGGVVDSDGDGVPDTIDNCDNTPSGVNVYTEGEQAGCPVDTDQDGIPDYIDECDNEVGPESNNGCPTTGGPCDNLDPVCSIPQTINDLEEYCYFTYPDFSNQDTFVTFNSTGDVILENSLSEEYGTLTLSGSVETGLTIEIDGNLPSDRVVAYEVEVRPETGSGPSSTCWQSFCESDVTPVIVNGDQEPIVLELDDARFTSFPIDIRVKAIICAPPL